MKSINESLWPFFAGFNLIVRPNSKNQLAPMAIFFRIRQYS